MKLPQKTIKSLLSAAFALGVIAAASHTYACGPDSYVGSICMTAAKLGCPKGFVPADGRMLKVAQQQILFSLIGTAYGGDGRELFALPNLDGKAQDGVHYCLATEGPYPPR